MKNNNLRKIILLVVVLSMIFTMTANAAVFTDISSHWAKSYIERVADNKLVEGYPDKTFKPDDNVTVLEALVMMSRLYEIEDDLKDEIIDKYEPILEKMPNTKGREWAFEYLSVILELGVVSESGMSNMFSTKSISQEATREEIAVMLAKALLLDLKKVYVLPFNDALEITESAKPYIYILYDKGIMQGDNKKNINPKDEITRAEIATLMDKAYTYIQEEDVYPDFDDYVPTTVVEGLITKLDTKSESYIYIKNNSEVESMIKINNDTEISINGKSRDFSDLEKDMLVECKIDEDKMAVEIEADSSIKVVRGVIDYVAYVEPARITIYDEEDDKIKYNVPSDAEVYLDGEETTLRKLNDDDDVIIILNEDDEVIRIISFSRIKHYEGVITSVDYTSYPIKITITTEEDVVKTFTFNSDVEVTKNDEESSFDKVRAGDEVTITTEYDEIIRIDTVAKEAEMNGTIKEIVIGPVNKLKIADSDGNVEQYTVSKSVIITIGDRNATISELRVGYNVSVNTSGDEIVTIEASELQTAMTFSGKVIYLNEDDELIMMQNQNNNGQNELVYVRYTDDTRVFDTSNKTKYIDDIYEGDNILVTAISQGGEYVAISILIQ